MPPLTDTQTDIDNILAQMVAAEPAGFDALVPGDILSDEASPTLNMWKITCDGC